MAFAGGAAVGGIVAVYKKNGKSSRKGRWVLLIIAIVVFVSIFSIVILTHQNRWKKMLYKMKKEGFFIIGMLSIAISVLLGRFFKGYPIMDFLSGMFCGISVVMNITFLHKFGAEKRSINFNKIE